MKNSNWINEIPKWICRPRKKPRNRNEKRKFISEYDRVIYFVLKIERDFIDKLFNSDIESYDKLYQFYLKKFIDGLELISKRNQDNHIVINYYFFQEKYKPINQ